MKHVVLALAVLHAAAYPAAQSSIAGRVVADRSGDPIPYARVLLYASNPADRIVVLTDADGRFLLPAPPKPESIYVRKARFAAAHVPAAAATESLEIRLSPAAAIGGRVIDELGDPVIAAQVTVEQQESAAVVAQTTTDDRGEYRIGGLPSGTFVVAVTAQRPVPYPAGFGRPAPPPARFKTFYPNAETKKEAQPQPLPSGEERRSVDFVLPGVRAGLQPFDVARIPEPARPRVFRRPDAAPPPSATIRGRVVDREGLPLPFAAVRLDRGGEGRTPPSRLARAGPDGAFVFRDVAAGGHQLYASKAGYFTAETSVGVDQRQTRDVLVTLARWSAIAGRVFDEHGDPVPDTAVSVLQLRYEGGRRRLFEAPSLSTRTDDTGAFRLYALRPGQYVVTARIDGRMVPDLVGYGRTFYPGTTAAADAQFVTVGDAAEVGSIEFGIARQRTLRVTGRFVNTAGNPTGGSLQLMPSYYSLTPATESFAARIFADGRFEFADVPPGDYVVQGYRGRLNAWTEGEFGAARVSVADSDVDGVLVRTSLGSSIHGQVVYEGDQSARPAGVAITPIPTDPDLSPPNNFATARVERDGAFVIDGVNGPRRLEVAGLPAGWMLREIRAGGVDITDRILSFGTADDSLRNVEVVLTDRVNTIGGVVQDERMRQVPGAAVIVFSADRSRWYSRSRFVRRAASAGDGRFAAAGLPAGSYYVVAVGQVPADGADAWQEPAYLEALIGSASSVALGEAEHLSLDLRVLR